MPDPVDFKALVEQVRHASDIVEVIGSYVPLKQAAGKFKGLSPFNREKTPSFYVDPGKQVFYCFSSHQGGDVFKFVELVDGHNFMGALRQLADRAGIEVPEYGKFANMGGGDRSLKEELYRLHEKVAAWWAELLHKDKAAEPARAYLRSRQFGSELAKRFQVGYAPPEWDATLSWAQKQKFSQEVLDQSGMVVVNEESGRRYDRFRGRLMFPIHSEVGKIVAFSGRLLEADAKAAKYVNSSETAIFVKSKTLFGLDKAKKAIRDEGFVLLCEGQIDTIRCVEKGFENTVASQGTAFGDSHARLLGRFADKAVICYDADNAGQKAAFGAAEFLLAAGFDVRIATMPPGDDPDTLLRRPEGPETLRAIVKEAPDYIRHLFASASREHDIASPRGRGRVSEIMAPAVARLNNEVDLQRTLMLVARMLEVPVETFSQEVAKAADALRRAPVPRFDDRAGSGQGPVDLHGPGGGSEAAPAPDLPLQADPRISGLLALGLHHPALVGLIQKELRPDQIAGFEGGVLLNRFLQLHGDGAWEDENLFLAQLPGPERNFVARLLLEPVPLGPEATPEQHLLDIAAKVKQEWRARRIRALEQEIKSGLLDPAQIVAKSKELLDLRQNRS